MRRHPHPGLGKDRMEQEDCPNCGAPGRTGAKFCAACGQAMSSTRHDPIAPPADLPGETAPQSDSPTEADIGEELAGWPSPPSPAEPFFGSGWHQRSPDQPTAASAPNDATTDEDASIWQDMTTDSWPSAPTGPEPDADPENAASKPEPDRQQTADVVEMDPSHGGSAETVAHAEALLDELRQTIASLTRGAPPDFSSVISDLEVAATPPGAMPPEEVAELREALLAARERPRDVDTIVDLTKRVDAMVSLAIAYDRAIAAIERSLAVLKTEGDEVTG